MSIPCHPSFQASSSTRDAKRKRYVRGDPVKRRSVRPSRSPLPWVWLAGLTLKGTPCHTARRQRASFQPFDEKYTHCLLGPRSKAQNRCGLSLRRNCDCLRNMARKVRSENGEGSRRPAVALLMTLLSFVNLGVLAACSGPGVRRRRGLTGASQSGSPQMG